MHPQPTLPPGVTVDQAGRAWAWKWLQGQNNHIAALKRRKGPARLYRVAHPALSSLIEVWLPYRIHEYPGYTQALATVCGVAYRTAQGWLVKRRVPNPRAVERLRALAAERVAAWSALEVELAELLEVSRRRKRPPHKGAEKRGC
jgi:hypothetical protein